MKMNMYCLPPRRQGVHEPSGSSWGVQQSHVSSRGSHPSSPSRCRLPRCRQRPTSTSSGEWGSLHPVWSPGSHSHPGTERGQWHPQLLHQDCDQNTHVHHGHLGDRVVSSTTSAAGQLVELLQNVSIIIGPRCNWGPIYGSWLSVTEWAYPTHCNNKYLCYNVSLLL